MGIETNKLFFIFLRTIDLSTNLGQIDYRELFGPCELSNSYRKFITGAYHE